MVSRRHAPCTDRFGNVMPDGVTEREIKSVDDVITLLAEGAARRVTESTRMNAVSSRRCVNIDHISCGYTNHFGFLNLTIHQYFSSAYAATPS